MTTIERAERKIIKEAKRWLACEHESRLAAAVHGLIKLERQRAKEGRKK